MATTLGFLPVLQSPAEPACARGDLVLVPTGNETQSSWVVTIADQERLTVRPAGDVVAGEVLLAELRATANAWWLTPRSRTLTVNGVRPLALMTLTPGDLLASGTYWWLTVSQWTPTPQPAPAELAEKPCPVCGGALNLAPIVQCPCGRFYHLENPQAAQDDLLNCYLAGPCRLCQRKPTLEPVLTPEAPEKLRGVSRDDPSD